MELILLWIFAGLLGLFGATICMLLLELHDKEE